MAKMLPFRFFHCAIRPKHINYFSSAFSLHIIFSLIFSTMLFINCHFHLELNMHFSTVNVGGYWVVKPKKRKIKEISFFGIKNIQRKKKSLISLISSQRDVWRQKKKYKWRKRKSATNFNYSTCCFKSSKNGN